MQWIVGAVVVMLLAASARCWLAAAARLRAGRELVPLEDRRPPPWGLIDLIAAVVLLAGLELAAVAMLGLETAGAQAAPDAASLERRAEAIAADSVAKLVMVGLSASIILLRTGARFGDLGFDLRKTRSDLKLGLAAFVMLAPLVYAIQWALVQQYESKHPLIELLRQHPSPRFFAVTALAAVVAAPLAEEYLFRVLLQGWLEKAAIHQGPLRRLLTGEPPWAIDAGDPGKVAPSDPEEAVDRDKLETADVAPSDAATDPLDDASPNPYSPPPPPRPLVAKSAGSSDRLPFWPILVSSLVFALLHLQHGPDCVALFVLALGLGYLYQRTHRILPCVLVHLLLNACSLVGLSITVFFPV